MTKLWHLFLEGGWMMYPVFALGLFAVGSAGRFAWRGEHQLLGFLRWLLGALLAAGCLGFTIGLMKTLNASQRPPDPQQMARIVMEGTTEAANVPGAALMFTIFTCLLIAAGHRRFPLPNPSAVAR
jgi:hypothetical protein